MIKTYYYKVHIHGGWGVECVGVSAEACGGQERGVRSPEAEITGNVGAENQIQVLCKGTKHS